MKKVTLFIAFFLTSTIIFSQTTSRVLSKTETQNLSNEFENIPYPIYKAYEYKDKDGIYNVLLCENQTKIIKSDSLNNKIMAIAMLNDHGGFVEKWSIKDEIISTNDVEFPETSIWFWSKYSSFKDIDGDGKIDPIIVYGSKSNDGEISRVKIFTIYKGIKYGIRAVECSLDDCRTFKKDDSIKTLPKKIQTYLDALLNKMRKEQNVLLKNG
ncbi:hypothetical protein IW15_18005 [Chryseobacterium soli]|uniref:Uncharacterized protein n=1 Tax=Chryseobacterium soli TaxID=445961 RepID=A0A086A2Y9_9FLAO|nr:hypothetical protein [Chryseobacterium soli]KFF11053.1 hypothetical protein IW15_18005 [Chryseobacterium soli]